MTFEPRAVAHIDPEWLDDEFVEAVVGVAASLRSATLDRHKPAPRTASRAAALADRLRKKMQNAIG